MSRNTSLMHNNLAINNILPYQLHSGTLTSTVHMTNDSAILIISFQLKSFHKLYCYITYLAETILLATTCCYNVC